MTSRREKSTSRRGREMISRRDVTESVSQEILTHYSAHFFENSPRVNFIPGIEHAVRPAPTLPGPAIKLTSRNTDHEHN